MVALSHGINMYNNRVWSAYSRRSVLRVKPEIGGLHGVRICTPVCFQNIEHVTATPTGFPVGDNSDCDEVYGAPPESVMVTMMITIRVGS